MLSQCTVDLYIRTRRFLFTSNKNCLVKRSPRNTAPQSLTTEQSYYVYTAIKAQSRVITSFITPLRALRIDPSSFLALNCRHNLPRVLARPELAVIDPLPRARVQPSVRNRHANTSTHQTALDVRGHIIQALRIVPVKLALPVLGRNAVQRIRHVLAHVFVIVFVQAQGARSVLDEEVHDADFVVLELGQLARDFIGDEVAAAGLGGERELFLEERHAGQLWC